MKVNWLRVGGAVIALSAVAAFIVSIDSRVKQDEFTRCAANVLDSAIITINARAIPAEKDRLALKQVFLDVTHSTSREQTLAALNRYNAAVAASDAERANLPLPEPVHTACN